MFVSAIIPAAGSGRRLGSKVRKQFLCLQGKPILYYTLRQFELSPMINEIIVVVPEAERQMVHEDLVQKYNFQKVSQIIAGGQERFDSVQNGLAALDSKAEFAAIHDGVRPFVSLQLIESVVRASFEFKAATLGVPVKDTIKMVQKGIIQRTLERQLLWAIQTPQVFQVDLIKHAYAQIENSSLLVTDDAMLVEMIQQQVQVIMGEYTNIKITSPDDLIFAECLVQKYFPE